MKKFILVFFTIVQIYAQNYRRQITELNRQPESVQKYEELGKIYDEIENYPKAIEYYVKALKLRPEHTPLMSKLSRVYQRYGQIKKAVQISEKIIQKDSSNYLEQYRLSKLYAQVGNRSKALNILYRLVQSDPTNANYHYKIGLYESDINRRLDAFLRAYHRDSMHKKNLYMLIASYKSIHFIDSATYYTDKALSVYPYDTKFLRQKVIADYRQRDYKGMLRYLKRLDSLRYDSLFVYKNTGLAYLKLAQSNKAEYFLQKAIQQDRQDPVNYYYMGLIYKQRNKWKKAEKYFHKAIQLKKPQIDKEYFELGMIAKLQKQYRKALNLFQKSFNNNPKNKEALLQLAFVSEAYYRSPEQAIKYYEKYLSLFKHKDASLSLFVQKELKKLKEKSFIKQ